MLTSTLDADHDVLTSTNANGNLTTNSYQFPMVAAAATPAHEKRLAVV